MAMVDATRIRMTAQEFFELPETNTPTELLEGDIIVSPSPVPLHQRIIGLIYTLLTKLIPNGEVFFAPIDVYFDEDNVPQPDVVWVAAESKCIVGEKRLIGPPDLIVEVFSPGTVRTDKKKKFRLYQKYGVREYWMVDPVEQYVEVWQHDGEKFIPAGVFEIGDTL
ncbi:MAG: Uma2 family endonuclease [Anaerolineae bacterium]